MLGNKEYKLPITVATRASRLVFRVLQIKSRKLLRMCLIGANSENGGLGRLGIAFD